MKIDNLYENDLRLFNIFAKKCKDEDEFKYNLKIMLKINYDYYNGKDNMDDVRKVNSLLGLDNEGCIHALLLNLFFKTGKNQIKEYIKEKIELNGIDSLNSDFNSEIGGKISIDRTLLDDLIKLYYESLDEKININKEDKRYILEINRYYKDECARVQLAANEHASNLKIVI